MGTVDSLMAEAKVQDTPYAPPRGLRPLARALARLRTLTLIERVAYGSICLYAGLFTFFAISRHLAFQSQQLDLGDMTQAIWNTSHGHFLETTMQDGGQIVRLGVHVDPFLVLLVPLWWVWSSPLMLVTLQALAVSAGALPVFWLARKHLENERASLFFVLAYLLYPSTQFNVFAPSTGFHPVSLAIPLLLFAIWFLDQDRLVAFAVVALLAATTKEEIPLVVGILGLWYAKRSGRWRFGIPVFALGLGLTILDFFVVIPHYLGDTTFFGDRYTAVGGSPSGVLRTAVTDPLAIVRDVATLHKLVYVLLLLLPFFGLWLLEPLLLLGAVPDLALNLLSSEPNQSSVAFQYTAAIVPIIVAGSIFGLARLRRSRRRIQRNLPRVSLYVLAAVTATAVYTPFLAGVGWVAQAWPSNPVHRAKAEALSFIPAGVPVSASNQLGAQLSERRRMLIFPAIREARWVIVDAHDSTYGDEVWYGHQVDGMRHRVGWRLIYSSRGVLVFTKPAAGLAERTARASRRLADRAQGAH
jgi:uncharacterized membrane protein